MLRKPMSPAEQLVGRRLPKDSTYLDHVMAGYAKKDGTTCARAEPVDAWLRPAFRKARKNGWLRLQSRMSLMGGKPFGIYQLTEAGREVALAARAKITSMREERKNWSQDFLEARKRLQAEAEAAKSDNPEGADHA